MVVFNPLCPVRFSYCYIVFTFAFLFRTKLSVSAEQRSLNKRFQNPNFTSVASNNALVIRDTDRKEM